MSWFRLDDQGAFHSKVLAAGNEAYGAWCRAGQWSCSHLTEGHVPRATAFTIAPPRVWKKLVEARLVDMREDESFQIHDFLDWNPTAEEVVAKRAARSEAGRRGGQRSVEVKRQQAAGDEPSKRQANAKQTSKQLLEQTPSKPEASAKQNSTPFPFPFPSPSQIEDQDPHTPAERGLALVVQGPSDPVSKAFAGYLEIRKAHRPRSRASKLKPNEVKRAKALLKTGYTAEDLILACEGLFLSPYHLGQNDGGTEYLEFFHAMGEKVVDGFIRRATEARSQRELSESVARVESSEPIPQLTPEQRADAEKRLAEIFPGIEDQIASIGGAR